MANQTQDVELRIRATNLSKQTTDKVVDSLKELTKAQDAQIESAKKGATSAATLEAGYTKIENAAKALISQGSLIKLFEAQSKASDESNVRLEAARKALSDYAASLDPAASKTRTQEAQLRALSKAVAGAEKAYASIQNRVAATGERLAQFGISTNDTASAQQKIVTAVNEANAALERQDKAIGGLTLRQERLQAVSEGRAAREAEIAMENAFEVASRKAAAALQAEADAKRASTQAGKDAQQERQVAVDVLFAQAERDAAEAINKKTAAVNAQNAALRAAADNAERIQRGAAGTARGAPAAPVSNVAATIRDIQDPSAAALRTVSGLEAAIASFENRVSQIRGPVQGYRQALQDAAEAQQALLKIARQVDVYNDQIAALRAARVEYVSARSAVRALVVELRSGATSDDVTTRLARAQNTLAAAATQLGNVTTAARGTRDALTAAGVNTNNIVQAQQNLASQATRSTAALSSLTDAYRRNGAAAESGAGSLLRWFSGGQAVQRVAGRIGSELVTLAAGFVGINAAIGLGKDVIEAYNTKQAILSRLTIANGNDSAAAAKDFDYLFAAANRIGFSFEKVAPAYAKFAIAAKAANFTTQQTRFVFESVAASSVKARLSVDETAGVFKALEQIMSKGVVQAEELRGQLGDRLPGAFQIAAKAANMSVADYTEAVTKGERGADDVIRIARGLAETYGAAVQGAATLQQAQARFDNASFAFKQALAEGGFVDAYSVFLEKLTALVSGDRGAKLAQELSDGFSAVVKVLGFLADNIGTVIRAFEALIAVNVVKWLLTLPALFRTLTAEIGLAAGALVTFEGFLGRAAAANALAAALGPTGLTGIAVRLAPALIGVGNALLFVTRALPVIGAAVLAYQATAAVLDKIDDRVRESVAVKMKAATQAVADAERAQAAAEAAKGTKDEERLKQQADSLKAIAVKAVKAQGAAVEEAKRQNVDLTAVAPKGASGAPLVGTPDPGDVENAEGIIARLKKRLAAEDKKTQEELTNQQLREQKKSLAGRLKIIDTEFDAERESVRKSITNGQDRATALELINKSSLSRQAAERLKFQNEQTQSDESALKRRERLATEIGMKLKEIEDDVAKRTAEQNAATEPYDKRRQARIDAIGNAYNETTKKIIEQSKLDPKAAAAAKEKLDLLIQQRQAEEGISSDRDEAVRLEKVFTDQQAVQKSQLEEINALYESGQISATEQLRRTNEAIEKTDPAIQKAGQSALQFANNVRAMLDPVAYQRLVATITAGIGKANAEVTISTNNAVAQQAKLGETMAAQGREIEQVSLLRKMGIIDSQEEAQRLNDITSRYKDVIMEGAQQYLVLLNAQRESGAITEDAYDKALTSTNNLILSTQYAKQAFSDLDGTITQSIAQNGVTAFDALATSMAKVITGTQTLGEGFRGAARAAGAFFAGILRDIALYIAKQLILKAIMGVFGASSGIGGAAAAMASGKHNGGIAGAAATFTRRVDASMFTGAPKYHTGGIVGLAPNEMPAILQRNEEVLTRDDPRHILNGGTNAGGGGGAGTRFVLVDDRSKVAEAMQTSEGEKVVIQHLRRNIPTIKQWLK